MRHVTVFAAIFILFGCSKENPHWDNNYLLLKGNWVSNSGGYETILTLDDHFIESQEMNLYSKFKLLNIEVISEGANGYKLQIQSKRYDSFFRSKDQFEIESNITHDTLKIWGSIWTKL